MKLSESVKPISYLKAHASELIRDVSENKRELVITHMERQKRSCWIWSAMSK